MTLDVYNTGGICSPSRIVHVLIVVLTAVLLGWKAAGLTAAAGVLAMAGMYYANASGLHVFTRPSAVLADLFGFASVCGLVDLVLMDVQMPEMDGYELVELLRSNKVTATMPVIFVSAIFSDEYHHRRGYEAGAVDFLSKPFHPDILLSKVKIFLQLYQQRIELEEKTNTGYVFHSTPGSRKCPDGQRGG